MSLLSVFDRKQWIKGAWASNSWNKHFISNDTVTTDYKNCNGVCAEGAIHVDMGRLDDYTSTVGLKWNYQASTRSKSPSIHQSDKVQQQIDTFNFRDSLHRVGDWIASDFLRSWVEKEENQELMRHRTRPRCECWLYQSKLDNTITEIDGVKYCMDWRVAKDAYDHNNVPTFNDQRGMKESVIKAFLTDLDRHPHYMAVRSLLRLSPKQFERVEEGFRKAYKKLDRPVYKYDHIIGSDTDMGRFYNALVETRCL
tara:strand:- start:11 stop:772 length:762 start_codon:yes stop_codon:yes gene_type:complete